MCMQLVDNLIVACFALFQNHNNRPQPFSIQILASRKLVSHPTSQSIQCLDILFTNLNITSSLSLESRRSFLQWVFAQD
jgi:hypothetical protein